ncbi:hypothetical protein QTG54_014193 [Skeletonema marinoi]|uniref:Uncharacterized protein n=1 Tax=Skeletonema marinoi TaxID=267567 RepID=A0AAD8XX79_9STRA|nr:hypothetical protein QTG54_014193 [Skeletonema marinoi]
MSNTSSSSSFSSPPQQPPQEKISSKSFYNEYHGHKLAHLRTLYPPLRSSCDALIWTAGDSSLDNKYWFTDRQPAEAAGPVYAQLLDPPSCVADVTFWLNHLENERHKEKKSGASNNNNHNDSTKYAAINTAVEATTLNQRSRSLLPQDKFIRDNISSQDILIVSICGNDVALAPTPCTIASIAGLLCCLPQSCLENGTTFGTVPMDDCCCGCGPSLASCTCACPPCLGYLRHLFGTRVQHYIEKLTANVKPKKILVAMIYYPDEANVPSWANGAVGALGYNSHPEKVQLLIRKMFEQATSRISIGGGSEVIPIPLFIPLDGTRSEDYVARVEPSAIGGRKMAEYLLDVIHQDGGAMSGGYDSTTTCIMGANVVAAPSTSFISGRER